MEGHRASTTATNNINKIDRHHVLDIDSRLAENAHHMHTPQTTAQFPRQGDGGGLGGQRARRHGRLAIVRVRCDVAPK